MRYKRWVDVESVSLNASATTMQSLAEMSRQDFQLRVVLSGIKWNKLPYHELVHSEICGDEPRRACFFVCLFVCFKEGQRKGGRTDPSAQGLVRLVSSSARGASWVGGVSPGWECASKQMCARGSFMEGKLLGKRLWS